MPTARSKLAQTSIAVAMDASALTLLGFVLAYWTWAWFAPTPLSQAMETSEPAGHLAAAAHLFGEASGDTHVGRSSGLAIKLLGVMAATPAGSGYALLQLDTKETQLVRAGEDLAPGIRVESVLPEQVILQRNGAREALAWPRSVPSPVSTTNSPIR